MFDLSKQKIDFPCPSCQRKLKVTLQQVAKQQSVTCLSCAETIQLQDKNRSASQSIRNVNKSFRSLEKTLKKFGK